jgi:hypothetical protein
MPPWLIVNLVRLAVQISPRGSMRRLSHRPALILAVSGAASGTLSAFNPGPAFEEAPLIGFYAVLIGLWFGLVIAIGVWKWGYRSWIASITALLGTWIGWEIAVNLDLAIEGSWLRGFAATNGTKASIGGFFAGMVGALVTWLGAAAFYRALQNLQAAASVTVIGALFGLLLPLATHYDSPIALFVPWQMAVAAMLGSHMLMHQKPT